MHPHLFPYLVLLSLLFLGALLMLTSSFLNPSPLAGWVKLDLRISGLAAFFVIIAKLTLLFFADSFAPFTRQALDYVKTLLLGIPIGLILLLVLNGELRGMLWKKKK